GARVSDDRADDGPGLARDDSFPVGAHRQSPGTAAGAAAGILHCFNYTALEILRWRFAADADWRGDLFCGAAFCAASDFVSGIVLQFADSESRGGNVDLSEGAAFRIHGSGGADFVLVSGCVGADSLCLAA